LKALTIDLLCHEAQEFSGAETGHAEPSLYGVTDGKAVGTYLEHKFRSHLLKRYSFKEGNTASGIDFPGLDVDMKVTSVRQPQSSSPFKSARQKIYGLGYGLIVFVYDKSDDAKKKSATLRITDTVFVEKHRTGDYQMTKGLRQIIENDGNVDDLMAFMVDSFQSTRSRWRTSQRRYSPTSLSRASLLSRTLSSGGCSTLVCSKRPAPRRG